ncbi:MAG: hypothetical protein QE263_07510 [Vampirovibrionales bacterium]|nr:hypothetical protein [Vampirovibrionales bacterium]
MKILFTAQPSPAQPSTVRNNSVRFGTTDEEYQQQLRKYLIVQQRTLDKLLLETEKRLKIKPLDDKTLSTLSQPSKKFLEKLKF